ncbi:MAG TPA: MFS transporter [Candidatus Omnitrophica bacterium]|nr:MFS transporter [Candidatus Omnitrophota bacterium]
MDKKSFFILCALFATLSFSVSATSALVPSIASYFGASKILAGKLVWIYMLPYGVCALLWAPLSKRFSLKKMIIFNLLLFSLSSLLVSGASSLEIAFLGRLGMGIFGSSFIPLSLIIIGKEIEENLRPRYIGFLFSLSFFSSLCGVFLSGIVFWRIIYLLPSLSAFVLFFLSIFFLKDFCYQRRFKISYLDVFKERKVLRLFMIISLCSFFYHSIHQWLGVYLANLNFDQFLISSVFTISALVAIVGENIGGFFASRFGKIKTTSLGLLSMSIFLFSLLFIKKWLIFILVIFWGLGWSFNHVGLSSILTSLPDEFLGESCSLNSSLRFFFGGLGSYLGGKSISISGFKIHFLLIGLFIFLLSINLKKFLITEGGRYGT